MPRYHVCSAEKVIDKILKRKIEWFNYDLLEGREKEEYYKKTQEILNNPIFHNEIKHFFADVVQHIAKTSKDFEEVRDLRMTMNGVEALLERMERIQNPLKQESVDEYADI